MVQMGTVVETWLEFMSNVENFVLNHNLIGIVKPISLRNLDFLLMAKRILWWVGPAHVLGSNHYEGLVRLVSWG